MLILLILSVLIFGIFVVCFCDLDDVKSTGFVVSIVCFFLSLLLFIEFDNSLSFQHLYFSQWIPEFGITFCIGVDGLSLFFVLLTTFIMPVTILSTWESIKNDIRTCYVLFLSIEVFLVLSFSALDLFLFYFSFESVLIPMVLIIILWGQRTRRIKAAYFFFFLLLLDLFLCC